MLFCSEFVRSAGAVRTDDSLRADVAKPVKTRRPALKFRCASDGTPSGKVNREVCPKLPDSLAQPTVTFGVPSVISKSTGIATVILQSQSIVVAFCLRFGSL